MKPHLNTVFENNDQSYQIKISDYYHALNELHYHEAAEIIFIIEGQGLLLIGEQFEEVKSGMLLIIGANIPHMFKFDSYTYLNTLMQQGKIDLPLKLLTLHLNPAVLGDTFMNLPENKLINDLLTDALKGISFLSPPKTTTTLLNKLMVALVYERIPLLMQLLNTLGLHRERKYITTIAGQAAYNINDENRLTKVYLYTLNNFTKNILLKDVAAMVYMVPNAFCRYFKQRTHKSYFTFLLEVRVRHACKLLKEKDYSIVIVCYESGFSNLSNFNRHFKEITGKTPFEYRNFFKSDNL